MKHWNYFDYIKIMKFYKIESRIIREYVNDKFNTRFSDAAISRLAEKPLKKGSRSREFILFNSGRVPTDLRRVVENNTPIESRKEALSKVPRSNKRRKKRKDIRRSVEVVVQKEEGTFPKTLAINKDRIRKEQMVPFSELKKIMIEEQLRFGSQEVRVFVENVLIRLRND